MPHSNLPQMKKITPCQKAKYDRAISLTAAAESPLTYHHHELAPSSVCFIVDLAQGDDSKHTPIVMIVAVVGVFQSLFFHDFPCSH